MASSPRDKSCWMSWQEGWQEHCCMHVLAIVCLLTMKVTTPWPVPGSCHSQECRLWEHADLVSLCLAEPRLFPHLHNGIRRSGSEEDCEEFTCTSASSAPTSAGAAVPGVITLRWAH